MLTQLLTVKSRLAIDEFDLKYDTLLTNAIKAITARFDKECNRSLERTVNATEEFSAHELELPLPRFPIETITKFELKEKETTGWVEQTNVDFLIRGSCVISLSAALGTWREQARVTYTGGYVPPGTTPGAGQSALPDDLEQAAVEQVAFWFQNRDKLGLIRNWPNDGTFQHFAELDLLPQVQSVLKRYERWSI
jgi:hypothetical protein